MSIRRLLAAGVFFWVEIVSAQPAATSPQSDAAAVRLIVAQYVAARNAHDAPATRQLFTVDADQLVSTGEWRHGADTLVRGAMASSQKEAAESSIAIETIRFPTPSIALVDGRYETVSAAGNSSRKMWTSLLLVKTPQGWRITAIRNMLPSPASR